jgi:hypothetical protein
MFLGCFEESKVYNLMKKADKRIIVSTNVISQENSMKLTSNKESKFEKIEENNEYYILNFSSCNNTLVM